MEDDIDIYADLSSFDLNPEKNDHDCSCKELKEELSSLMSKLENIERVKTNLENNLSSLLKTARAEITRKDKTIDELRKRLDDVTFRRSYNYKPLGFSNRRLHQHTVARKYENVPSIHSQESETEEETESYQVKFCHDEYKSGKPQNDYRMFTVFGERLHKRIIEKEKEEKKQKELIKLGAETKIKDISKENIIENDKNESQFGMNNNDNESNIGRRSSSSESSYRKNLMKRTNEEDDISRHKRIKIEKNEDKTVIQETDYNHCTQYDLTDNLAQYKMKDNLKIEDRLDTARSFKKEEIPFCDERRAASEYRDTKQDRSYTNGWRSEAKSRSVKDYESSNIRNGHANSLRNSRTSTSRTIPASERFNSGYKQNGYRYSPLRRSYSRSRSDYESLSSHLRERFSRTYREKKYDDYKYDSRYKNDRLKRNYEDDENDRKARYRREKRGDLRDKYRYSSSDAEDKESSSFYKNMKHENHRSRKETISVLNDKKLHENDKAEINLRESSSRTIVNSTINFSASKNVEQHKVKNESEIKSKDLSESMSAKKDLEHIPEEGEILDSPEKKNNSTKILEDNRREENNVKIISKLFENKNEDISVNTSIDNKSMSLQNNANGTKQLEAADISTKEIEIASCLMQENLKNCEEIIQLNFCKSDMAADETHNCLKDKDKCKSHINKDLMESLTQNIGIITECDSDINSNDKNDTNKRLKDSIETIKIKKVIDSNIENVTKSSTKIKEIDNFSIENASKNKEISNSNIGSVIEITEAMNNFNNSKSIHKIDDDELRITAKVITKVEAVLNCDIEDRNKSPAIESDTLHQMSSKSTTEICLNDHNYVQNPSSNVSDLDAIQKSFLKSERNAAVLDTATSKETKAEETINVQSVKRIISSIVKNKKNQQNKGILISHRRKAVILSDSNASMTVLMNTAETSSVINNCNNNDSTFKPRACKISRVTTKGTCK